MNRESITLQGMVPLFQVFDMATSINFYVEVLGFEVISTSAPQGEHFDWALLRRNEVELMLNTAYEQDQRPPFPDPLRVAAHEDTALYFGCPDVDALYAFLLSKNIAAQKPFITGYDWKALHLKDPDGYLLCFHWPVKE
jgi:catechol 2,3-dioxygenase-like lactoylglutathione lyase family enzyme